MVEVLQPATAPAPQDVPAPTVQPIPNKMARIAQDVAELLAVPITEMYSDRRQREYARARQAAMWCVVQTTPFSLVMIGRHFRRDHTTVMHAIKTMDYLRTRDAELANLLDAVVVRHGVA